MHKRVGTLTEISPLGTGFIADSSGQAFGFHYSMLADPIAQSSSNWTLELENKFVSFDVEAGVARNVKLLEKTLPSPATRLASNAKAAS